MESVVSSKVAEPAATPAAERSGQVACLLCGGACRADRHLTWSQLERLWKLSGIQFSPGAWPARSPGGAVEVWRCRGCGFEFSDTAQAGNGQFYAELQAQAENYYPERPFEFVRGVDFARTHGLKDVLDVGCGSGVFLSMAKAAGLETHGMELNPEGARLARAAGHTLHEGLIGDLVRRAGAPRFSFVTAWQVMEHVNDPVGFLRDCAQAVRPGGFVGIGVPNESTMRWLCPYDPHGWPPHHVTRWRIRDLEAIGHAAGLAMVESGAEPLTGALGEHFWLLHNRLAGEVGARPHRGGRWLPRLFWLAYRKAGLRHWRPIPGSSIYAMYRRDPNAS